MAEERPVVLYPAYFDLRRTREEGRRVPKGLAVETPTVEEIEKAAKALGLQPTVEADKAFPGSHWRHDGRVLVRGDYFKTSIVRKVAERLKAGRKA
jgi:signal recognition particle subunit SRP19